MMVFFDLPMVTKSEKRAYTVFRRFLLNDGYDMIQFSVYGRILNGSDAEKNIYNVYKPTFHLKVQCGS
jgi:CRISPR-associated protein Cas2